MVKTRELYYEDAYISEFEAQVTSCEKEDGGAYKICLDRTAFFPEQGGQTSDIGTLTGPAGEVVKVSHTSIEDGIITHITDGALNLGDTVTGKIDFSHRFSNMQQHTGEHIFSGVVHSRFGYDNVGFHLSDSEVTMDYNGPISDSEIREIELTVNQLIWHNLPVKCYFPSEEELSGLDYRSKKELLGAIRIVEIEGVDVCACCAPHVAWTGEIGFLKVVKTQNYKGGVRVYILCGERGLKYLDEQQKIVSDLGVFLTTGSDKIFDSVKRLSDDNSFLKGELSELKKKLTGYEIKEINPDLEDVYLVKEAGLDMNIMRETANLLAKEHRGFCGVFSGSDEDGYKYIIASGTDNKDAKALSESLKDKFAAKGGGNSAMVQGSLPAVSIAGVLEFFKS